jgi:photosystem II stability/assembly factor-like uncharacterized protein
LKKILTLTFLYGISISALVYYSSKKEVHSLDNNRQHRKQHFDGPAEFAKFHHDIRTAAGKSAPDYKPAYRLRELLKAEQRAQVFQARTKSNGVITFTERGPNNVPGRTRGLIVDPDDPNKNTWFAGSVGGGIWKTTNAGQTWTDLTPDLPNLATSVLAMAESNHNIIYAGTGEGFFNLDAINGSGIFKSTDRGVTWSILTSTIDFGDVNRIVISPSDPDLLCAATSTGLYRSTNGGTSWTEVLNQNNIQDLKATPGNFSILYATQNSTAIWKSINAGLTWSQSSNGMGLFGRVELAISPVNPNRIFASAEQEAFGEGSNLYVSDNAGQTWSFVNVSINGSKVDFLNEQGWYDNTIACDPFNQNIIYFGGVDLFRTQLTSGSTTVNVLELEEDNTSNFLSLVSFTNATNGNFDVGPSANNTSVEIRFGPGKSQKAHRFLVPEGRTSGVAANEYSYQDYVTVPFEVWDITNNRQLMVSFRDQGRDGAFNLINNNTTSTIATEQSREYVFINNVTYNASTPSSGITANGGHEFNEMYNIWPFLTAGGSWPPAANGNLRIVSTAVQELNATTINITDGRGDFGNGKNNNVHVDHHNLVMIPMSASTYKILNANDGGVFISNISSTPGINNNNWTSTDNGYNTSQFYGADKRTDANEYFGGMQDNGTWLSPANQISAANTNYAFKIGGDGFEVIWHNLNTQLLIGGSQGNGFARSVNGGVTFAAATSGLPSTDDYPFITKLANSRDLPDRIFCLGGDGVYVSNNFGQNWTLTPITQKWATASFMDVEVSRANADIVWAGVGMTSSLNLHVSTNGGKTFSLTNNFTTVTMGGITKLASHPTEPNTAYAIFSLAEKPKILKTTNLGQSWTDISGFGTNSISSTGFPDVAVYCLYVRPDNTNIIWAGTEIGIVESLDGGASWALLNNFLNVSVWDMKGVDDQIVIATHGRGIWTATIDAAQSERISVPVITAAGTSPDEKLAILLTSSEAFDSVQVFAGNAKIGSIKNPIVGETVAKISGLSFGNRTISGVAYKNGAPYSTNTITAKYVDLSPSQTSFSDYFTNLNNFSVSNFLLNIFTDQSPSVRRTLHTKSTYDANAAYEALLLVPIDIRNTNANFSYRDVAIVEPVNDYVVVEATTDGVRWVELQERYDAAKNTSWLSTFNTTNGKGTYSQMVAHEIDLLSLFNPGEKVLFRFRLSSNNTIQSWGWGIDYVAIQEDPAEAEFSTISKTISIVPNPASETAKLWYSLANKSDVTIHVVNVLGSTVASIMETGKERGDHKVTLPINGLSPGSYIVVVQKEGKKETTRLVID